MHDGEPAGSCGLSFAPGSTAAVDDVGRILSFDDVFRRLSGLRRHVRHSGFRHEVTVAIEGMNLIEEDHVLDFGNFY